MKRTSSHAMGFYIIPYNFWIGESRQKWVNEQRSREYMAETVFSGDGPMGTKITVRRDEFHIFDFRLCDTLAPVEMPEILNRDSGEKNEDFSKAEEIATARMYDRLTTINAYMTCFYTAKSRAAKMGSMMGLHYGPEDVVNMYYNGNKFVASVDPSMPAIAAVSRAIERAVINDNDNFNFRTLLPLEVIELGVSLLNKVSTAKLQNALGLFALLYRSQWQYSRHDWAGALMSSWLITEQLVGIMWGQYINEDRINGVVVTSDRKKKLKGRDYSASVIVEILALAGRINQEQYDGYSRARKVRNDWIHGLNQVDPMDSAKSIITCAGTLSKITEIDILPSLGYSTSV